MRTRFMYSLYLFSSFVQGYFCLLPMLSRMPAPSHASCPHATCHMPHCSHPDSLLGPHPRPNSKHNQNQPKKHFLGLVASPPPPAQKGNCGDVRAVVISQPRALPRVLHSRAIRS